MTRFFHFLILLLVSAPLHAQQAQAAPSAESPDSPEARATANPLEERVRRFTLDNGMTFLLAPRTGAPIFSAYIRVKVGSIEESVGNTGLAHFFEHMAFKGTSSIGVTDAEKEAVLLKRIHEIGSQLTALPSKTTPEALSMKAELKKLEEEAAQFLIKNEFINIYQRNGGSDMNATTSTDFTSYFVSLPANRLELWAYMESSRLKNPVFREFYTERDVVAEERRMRYDTDPDGKLYEAYMGLAFDKSPYKHPVIGYAEDIQNFNYEAALNFYEKYYIPSRMTVALVGNFDVDQAEALVRRYFSGLPAKEDPPLSVSPQVFDKTFPRNKIVRLKEEPRLYVGFHRPAFPHPDDIVLDVLEQVLCDGRTSRLYSVLVKQKKMASSVDCYGSLPGSRLDGLFTVYAKPLKPYTNAQLTKEILAQLEKVKKEKVSTADLTKVKNKLKADTIYALEGNMGLASLLTFFENLTGDWRYLFQLEEKVEQVTADDVQRVAKTYLVPGRRVTVSLEK